MRSLVSGSSKICTCYRIVGQPLRSWQEISSQGEPACWVVKSSHACWKKAIPCVPGAARLSAARPAWN